MTVAPPASGEPTQKACVGANAQGQQFRRNGKFGAAREQFQLCNVPACPVVVAEDCTTRVDELDVAQPTVIFDVRDRAGHDVSDATVALDGDPFADRLNGAAVRVDPGEHVFTFTLPNEAPVLQKVVIKEGEKGRRVRVSLSPEAVPSPAVTAEPAAPPPQASEPPVDGHKANLRRTIGMVATGVGAASVLVGGAFGLLTLVAVSDQQANCPTTQNCPNRAQAANDHSTWTTDSVISGTTLVAGGVFVAGGLYLWLTSHRAPEKPAARTVSLVPAVGPNGASALLYGEF
jgi:hypothetical protein